MDNTIANSPIPLGKKNPIIFYECIIVIVSIVISGYLLLAVLQDDFLQWKIMRDISHNYLITMMITTAIISKLNCNLYSSIYNSLTSKSDRLQRIYQRYAFIIKKPAAPPLTPAFIMPGETMFD